MRTLLWILFTFVLIVETGCQEKAPAEDFKMDGINSVVVLFSTAGLGDRGYNDNIYRGLREFEKDHAIALEFYSPKRYADAERFIEGWYDEGKDTVYARYVKKRLLILADGSYTPLFKKHSSWKSTDYSTVLMLDSKNTDSLDLYSRYVSLYGVSHWAAQIICKMGTAKAAVIAANPNIGAINEAVDGFAQGFNVAGGTFDTSDVYYLDSAFAGFDQASRVYHMSYDLDSLGYQFIFPVAGGSDDGLFRYTREYGDSSFFTCGMDVDKQAYSRQIAFSIVKRIDLVANEFIESWLKGEPLAKYAQYGLNSHFVTVIVAKTFAKLHYDFSNLMNRAIESEKEYMKW